MNSRVAADRLLERRRKQAGFRDANRTLDSFDFTFNPKMNRSLVFDLATVRLHRQARRRSVSRTRRHGQESSGSGHRPVRHFAGLSRLLSRSARTAG